MCVFSLDSGGGPREDGGMQLPVGAGGSGAAGQQTGGVASILRRQTGTLAGERRRLAFLSQRKYPSTSTASCFCFSVGLFFFLFFFSVLSNTFARHRVMVPAARTS